MKVRNLLPASGFSTGRDCDRLHAMRGDSQNRGAPVRWRRIATIIVLMVPVALACTLALRQIGVGSDRRYTALTTAAAAALDKGDDRAAARLALAATPGRPLLGRDTARAEGLLLTAVMAGKAPLRLVATKQFPKFNVSRTGVWPATEAISSNGFRLLIAQNLTADWKTDVVDRKSGRVLRRYDDLIGTPSSTVAALSSDMNTAVRWSGRGYYFEDVSSARRLLQNVSVPKDFYDVTISNDRTLVTAVKDRTMRVWQVRGTSVKTFDYQFATPFDADLAQPWSGSSLLRLPRSVLAQGGPVRAVRFAFENRTTDNYAFSRDGSYAIESRPDGARVWNTWTGTPVSPILHVPEVWSAGWGDSPFLPLLTVSDWRLLDLRSGTLIGAAMTNPDVEGRTLALRGDKVYTLTSDHVLMTWALDPLLRAPLGKLRAAACAKWRGKEALRLTPAERKTYGLKLAVAPCR